MNQPDSMTTEAASGDPNRPDGRKRVWLRHTLFIGLLMGLVWSVGMVAWAIVRPDPYAQGWRLALELAFVGGRAVNIADGISSGFSRSYLFFQCGLQDIAMLLIFFPLAVGAYEGAERDVLKRAIERLRKAAERRKDVVEPFGAVGLWLFVFFPFWSTGVLVGAILGYLIGIRARVVFASVISSHVVSVVSLVWFFDLTHGLLEKFSSGAAAYLPWIVLAILIVLAVLYKAFHSSDGPDAEEANPPSDNDEAENE